MDKYANINKVLRKYGQTTISELVSIVGVDTGALKNSIKVSYTDEGYITKMLAYGEDINPWIKKGDGSQNYIQVFDKIVPKLVKELSPAAAKDVANEIRSKARKKKNLKVR